MWTNLLHRAARRLGLEEPPPRPAPPPAASTTRAPLTADSTALEKDPLASDDGSPIPDREFYQGLFSPWARGGYGAFADALRLTTPSLVSPDRCWVLYSLARQAAHVAGDVWECGVYKGGTAAMLARLIADEPAAAGKRLHLFDTFAGMPEADPARDYVRAGDFADTSLERVRALVGHADRVQFHVGRIPETFSRLEASVISIAHIDVDMYQSVKDCIAFTLPRLSVGGVLVFDDYGFPTCAGARQAVDEAFAGTRYVPLVLPTGQAIVFKAVPDGVSGPPI